MIRLATTTSVENSGLLDVLLPAFQAATGIEVQVMSMGTGKALQVAKDGGCDGVLVHAPAQETQFVRDGWGVDHRAIMYNDFLLVGPASDPAGIKGTASAAEAMAKIAKAGAVFVSRGDNSGTHQKELKLWRAAGVEPAWAGYRSVGRGMGETLTMANEMSGYTLTDRGTFLKFHSKVQLAVLVEGDPVLDNPYSMMAVNPKKHPHVKHAEVMKLIEFLTGEEGRRLIAGYRIEGEPAFPPWPTEEESQAAIRETLATQPGASTQEGPATQPGAATREGAGP